ncbi:MAG: hypothetical protein AB1700_02105 [Bacillota bacterium]
MKFSPESVKVTSISKEYADEYTAALGPTRALVTIGGDVLAEVVVTFDYPGKRLLITKWLGRSLLRKTRGEGKPKEVGE